MYEKLLIDSLAAIDRKMKIEHDFTKNCILAFRNIALRVATRDAEIKERYKCDHDFILF